jgi:hypothetical protein
MHKEKINKQSDFCNKWNYCDGAKENGADTKGGETLKIHRDRQSDKLTINETKNK